MQTQLATTPDSRPSVNKSEPIRVSAGSLSSTAVPSAANGDDVLSVPKALSVIAVEPPAPQNAQIHHSRANGSTSKGSIGSVTKPATLSCPAPLTASSSAVLCSSSPAHSPEAPSLSRSVSRRSRQQHTHFHTELDPFGPTDWRSAQRCVDQNAPLLRCQWRLQERKGIFDVAGPVYCNRGFITAHNLSRHVLDEHMPSLNLELDVVAATKDHPLVSAAAMSRTPSSGTLTTSTRYPCRWGTCANRQYLPRDLAAHLVHDHLCNQLGFKYACPTANCPVANSAVLTSQEALDRHLVQYHGHLAHLPLRPIWGPVRPRLAQLPPKLPTGSLLSYCLPPLRITSFPSSGHRYNGKGKGKAVDDTDAHARIAQEVSDLKRELLDDQKLVTGDGKVNEPWARLERRIKARMRHFERIEAAEDAVYEAEPYTTEDLDAQNRLWMSHVDVPNDPIIEAIGSGIWSATSYTPFRLPPPPLVQIPALIDKSMPAERCTEELCEASAFSAQREVNFDIGQILSRRFAARVTNPLSSKSRPKKSISQLAEACVEGSKAATTLPRAGPSAFLWDDESEEWTTDDHGQSDWTPPLWCRVYHPLSRRMPSFVPEAEMDQVSKAAPTAIRRRQAPVCTEAADRPLSEESALPQENRFLAATTASRLQMSPIQALGETLATRPQQKMEPSLSSIAPSESRAFPVQALSFEPLDARNGRSTHDASLCSANRVKQEPGTTGLLSKRPASALAVSNGPIPNKRPRHDSVAASDLTDEDFRASPTRIADGKMSVPTEDRDSHARLVI
ncbi:hypothetical protein BCV70DRAFT_12536 [Testicularia cyperi]|uniref:Uncharacterized protein n=1 Tax=Testicularia cyperi TaxID=1882483 RepID=A0A317Y0J1_9BASI|nr:hypothetical protein BCV70DRAFT_12536 [Testicularia cyperi]